MRLLIHFVLFAIFTPFSPFVTASDLDITPPTPLASLMGLPNSFVNGCVNVIAGDYCEAETDIVLAGPDPLVLQRSYSSSRSIGELSHQGWAFSHCCLAKINSNKHEYFAEVMEQSGGVLSYYSPSILTFHGKGPKILDRLPIPGENITINSLTIQSELLKNGLTNCGGGEISGRTNPKNTTVVPTNIHKTRDCKVVSGGGETRYFEKKGKPWSKTSPFFILMLTADQKSNGNCIRYAYNMAGRCELITAKDASDQVVFSSLSIKEDSKAHTTVFTGSDGRQATHYFEGKGKGLIRIPLLKKVVRPHSPSTIHYAYGPANDWHGSLLCRKEKPEGRVLITEYYDDGDNDVGGTRVRINPLEDDVKRNRVKLQKAPVGMTSTPLITHRFFYKIRVSHDKPKEGYTNVYDALDYLTRYYFSKEQRLTFIQHFHAGNKSLHSTEQFSWGTAQDKGNLMSVALSDGQGKVIHSRCFVYDVHGNILQEIFSGDLTGKGEVESSIKTFSYGQNHLVTHERDALGKEVEYSYKPGTNLVISKLISDNGTILFREFYDYDNNSVLVSKVSDDGCSPLKSDLSGVTERHILVITPRQQHPGYGQPETIDEYAFDLSGGEPVAVLLKRVLRKYSPEGRVVCEEVYDANGNFAGSTEYAYDSLGNKILERNALGHTLRFHYDLNGNVVSEEGPRPGALYTYAYDYSDRLIRKDTYNEGLTLSNCYQYDLCSRVVMSTDLFGNATNYEYDALGNCTQTYLPAVPDPKGNLIRPVIKKTYDVSGNVTSLTDPRGFVTTTSYNARNQPTLTCYPDGTREEYRYTLEGQISQHLAKNGTLTCFTYDVLGRVVKEEVQAEGQPLKSTEYAYRGFHCTEMTDAEGNVTHYHYDFAGRPSSTVQGDAVTHYAYDALGRQHITTQGGGIEAMVQVKEYDVLSRVIEERIEDSEGNIQHFTRYAYDEANNRTTVFSSQGAATFTNYNLLNQPVSVTDPLGNVTLIAYDYTFRNEHGQGALETTTTTPLGNQMIVTLDAGGREASVIKKDPFGQVVAGKRNVYDLSGNKIRTEESAIAQGQQDRQVMTVWEYGPLNRIEKVIQAFGEPIQKTISYLYDAFGFKQTTVKPDGVRLEHRYDVLGRLSEFYATDHTFSYRYTYDRNDNLLEVEDLVHSMTTCRSYDAMQRLVEEKQGTGLTLSYAYDTLGRPLEITLPDNSSIRYRYEGIGLKQVSRYDPLGHEKYTHHYLEYDLDGHLLSSSCLGKAGNIRFSYDIMGRIIACTAPHYTFEVPSGGYDADGSLIHCRFADPQGEVEGRYSYDALYQINREEGVASHLYCHDSLYNRIQKDENPCSVNALNHLLEEGSCRYTYDLNGNLIAKAQGEHVFYYHYDALDRLIAVESEEEGKVCYRYDSLDRRLSKTVERWDPSSQLYREETLDFLYDQHNEIGAVSDGDIIELRILGTGKGAEIGAAIAIELGDTVYVPIHDYRGNVAVLLNPDDGQVVASYRYTAFGEESLEGSVISPWRFSSKRVDSRTGFVCFGRRDYDPQMARWLTPDPAGFIEGPNLYAYVLNSPLTRFDLYGLFGRPEEVFQEMRNRYPEETRQREARKQQRLEERSRWRNSEGNPFQKIKGGFVSIMETLARFDPTGITSYFGAHQSVPFQVGQGEVSDGVRVTSVNGICNSRMEAEASAGLISKAHGNVKVHGIYDASHGWLADLIECLLSRLGIIFHPARLLVAEWRKLMHEMGNLGTIYHYPHSQGGITTHLALKQLHPDERKRINIASFGSAKLIDGKGTAGTINYVSKADLIPLTDFTTWIFGKANVAYLPCLNKNKWFDHSFSSPTYQTALMRRGNDFIHQHGVIQ